MKVEAGQKCQRCLKEQRRESDKRRNRDWQHLYNTAAWKMIRKFHLAEHPLCVDPDRVHGGRYVVATTVDHIIAHKGDRALFFDRSNHQSLCGSCNSRKAARTEGAFGNARK